MVISYSGLKLLQEKHKQSLQMKSNQQIRDIDWPLEIFEKSDAKEISNKIRI